MVTRGRLPLPESWVDGEVASDRVVAADAAPEAKAANIAPLSAKLNITFRICNRRSPYRGQPLRIRGYVVNRLVGMETSPTTLS